MQKGLAIIIQIHDGPTEKLASRSEYEKIADKLEGFLINNDEYCVIDITQVK